MNGTAWIVRAVERDRKRHLALLLEADPDEAMIARYLERGDMYVVEERGETAAVAVVTLVERAGKVGCELKNLAVRADCRGRGLARFLVDELCRRYAAAGRAFFLVGTSESGVGLYRKLGFAPSHVVRGFFADNYPVPIWENGKRCVDMIYLRRELRPESKATGTSV